MTRATWWITAAVIAAAAVGAAVVAWREPRDPLVRLARAAGKFDTRLTEARLSGFAFRPHPTSSHPQTRDAAHLRFRALAGEVLQSTAHDDHAAGIAALLLGANDDALKRLTACAETHPTDAAIWNDLAAARYTAANANDDPQQLVSALAAADHALRITPVPEAAFNRGLILESLGLYAPAAKQYASYERTSLEGGWKAEAQQRLTRLHVPTAAQQWHTTLPRLRRAAATREKTTVDAIVTEFPQEARTWAEAVFLNEWAEAVMHHDILAAGQHLQAIDAIAQALLSTHGERLLYDALAAIRSERDSSHIDALARAQIAYLRGRKLYAARNVAEALPLFKAAAAQFGAFRNPMARVAEYYLGCALFDRGLDSESLSILQRQLAESPKAYVALHAQVLWEIAEVMTLRGRFYDALSAESQASTLFSFLGERDNAATVESQAAATSALLGRRPEAWRRRIGVFRQASSVGDTLLQQRVIDVAARTEALEERWGSAYALFLLAVDSSLRANPRIYTNSAIWAGLTADKLGLHPKAAEHLEEAKVALATIPDEVLRRRAEAELTLAMASVSTRRQPQRALALLNAYIKHETSVGNTFLLPEALLQRAAIRRTAGNIDAAIDDLQRASPILRARSDTGQDEFPDAFFQTREAVSRELTAALYDRGDHSAAFAAIDTARTEGITSHRAANATGAIVPPGTLIVEYVAYPERLLVLTRDNRTISARVVATTVNDIVRSCGNFDAVTGIVKPACYDILLRPIEPALEGMTRLIIIPDHIVASVPFAALRVASGQYLAEITEITISPSATLALLPAPRIDPTAVTVVGNPRFDTSRFPGLPNLPAAQSEAKAVASLYPNATLLVGTDATKDHVLSAMKESSIIHIASHAVVVAGDQRRSHLLLAPTASDPGMLFLSDLNGSILQHATLIVVAGCRTAVNAHETTNVGSFALAFLAAGVPNAIGTLHDVDDHAASTFAVALHHELQGGATPSAALRAVQIAMLHSPDARLRQPAVWSSFQVYGSAIAPKSIPLSVHRGKEN